MCLPWVTELRIKISRLFSKSKEMCCGSRKKEEEGLRYFKLRLSNRKY